MAFEFPVDPTLDKEGRLQALVPLLPAPEPARPVDLKELDGVWDFDFNSRSGATGAYARMQRDRLVFLSDIHIGVDARTNWYQSRYHEPCCARCSTGSSPAPTGSPSCSSWVTSSISGPIYVPTERPPSFAQIAATTFDQSGLPFRAY